MNLRTLFSYSLRNVLVLFPLGPHPTPTLFPKIPRSNVLCPLAVAQAARLCWMYCFPILEPRVFIVVAFSICLWFQSTIYLFCILTYTNEKKDDIYDEMIWIIHYIIYIHIFYLLLCAQTLHIVLKVYKIPWFRTYPFGTRYLAAHLSQAV